ncbi:helix-turn-helix transcriptional regulator [Chitinophaga barathri]|uniref:YafY family transcriptional regulator n=1 Tax=Chitinophaga barathri TaxID=1647451 RepID=A0A3N4M995_9BACT|nr:YafY family protein [Chitinophaga barathri]RPD40081.1 YafY family transcriptional regulator [Chitinophaga barathri]
MNRIDRLTAILIQLQGKKIVKAQEIADRYNLSLRTVYRDVKALMEAGVPIGSEAGTGYYIVDGYHLPPIMFNRTEAAALLTGEKLMEKHSDRSNHQQFSNAMQKIRAVLRGNDKDFLESLDDNIAVLRSPRVSTDEQFPNRFLTDIQEAVARQRVLSMEYYSFHSDSVSRREIEPIGIFHMNSSWHLIGYCLLRKDYRDFRADRIKSLHLTDKNFDKSKRMGLQEYISKEFQAESEQPTLVKIRFSHDVARYLREQKYYYGVVHEKSEEQYVEMHFMYNHLSYFARWLMMMGKGATIVEPQDLKQLVRKQIDELDKHHS